MISCGSGDMLSGATGGEFGIPLSVAVSLEQPVQFSASLIPFFNDFENNETCLLRYVSSCVHVFYLVLMLPSKRLLNYFRPVTVECCKKAMKVSCLYLL